MVCLWLQVLVAEFLTPEDSKAEGMVGPALQACLAMLTASAEAEDLAASTKLLQHLIPSQKHLAMLQQHMQVSLVLLSLHAMLLQNGM